MAIRPLSGGDYGEMSAIPAKIIALYNANIQNSNTKWREREQAKQKRFQKYFVFIYSYIHT